ncbi:MAG: T9SS type A sorting domain-containing protein [Candidatus Marinimicrobia bacterium]|nr:T9SS type A sorting domain-containing protein [Candidatus Neomarinimicrobiota bacterium]
MNLFRYLVIILLITLYSLGATDRISINVDMDEAPDILELYFTFPKANSQYVINDVVVDMFRWKVQADDFSNIQCSLVDAKWISIPTGSYEFDIHQIPEVLIQPFKDNQYFVDVIPWKFEINGQISYLSQGNIDITFGGNSGDILSGPGIVDKVALLPLVRSLADSLQYLILTNQALLPAAESIADLYNEDIDPNFQLNTDVALMDTLTLPVRDFLFQQLTEYPMLQYVMFMGDETVIPPMTIFTYDPSVPGYIQRPSDDFFTSYPEYSAYTHLTSGRIPVNQLSDAMIFVNKLRDYVLNPLQGNWRNKLVLLADDTNKNNGDISTEISHVQNSDEIYVLLNQLLEIQPIYGTEYQPIPGDGWLLQPQMTQATLESINSGVAMINYIGHGSPTTLADEKIILMNRDLSSIQDPTGAIWVVGTCSFGWYDNEECMTEKLLSKPDGAIGLISTTFKVNVFSNSNYLNRLFDNIRGYIENENSYRLGDLVRYSKEGGQDYWFHTFGDPAMPLPFPRKAAIIDTSATSSSFDILQPFDISLNSGYIMTYGYADIRGAENQITRFYDTVTLSYLLPGNVIYQGVFSSSDLTFIVPLDVSSCESCVGSIRVYSENGDVQTDFLGGIPIIPFSGNQDDLEGPLAVLRQNNNQVSDQGVIFPPYIFQLWLTDNSGINLTGSIGHSLRYQIDESSIMDFSEDFTTISPTEGFFNLDMSEEQSGYHSLWIEVWDNANNRSEEVLNIYFSDAENFRVELIYNYPNPFSDDTYFTFHLSHAASVSIRVFTTDGRQLITLNRDNLDAGYQSIYWNGKDSRGLEPANGTYFYQIRADNEAGDQFDSIQKLTRIK